VPAPHVTAKVGQNVHIADITRAPLQPDRFQRAPQGVNTLAVEIKLVRIDCLAFSDLCEAFFEALTFDRQCAGAPDDRLLNRRRVLDAAEITLSDQRSSRVHGEPIHGDDRWSFVPFIIL
jgi:hypothetical protein